MRRARFRPVVLLERARSPRRISTASSRVGSSTHTAWKRRSIAGSLSMSRRYSAVVVAPMSLILPRASAGLKIFAASIETSAGPGTDEGMNLVDEQNHLRRCFRLFHDRLQPLLKLAAILRTGDERRTWKSPRSSHRAETPGGAVTRFPSPSRVPGASACGQRGRPGPASRWRR